MWPEEKKRAAAIWSSFDNSFTVACVQDLHTKLHVPMADMQNLRVCLELAALDPTHLDRGVPEKASDAIAPAVDAVQASMAGVADGLRSFEMHPKGDDGKQIYSGIDKFDHLIKMARRSLPARSTLAPSSYLNVEFSQEQQRILDPLPIDFAMHDLMSTTHGAGAERRIATLQGASMTIWAMSADIVASQTTLSG
jgi:hypothetical protein